MNIHHNHVICTHTDYAHRRMELSIHVNITTQNKKYIMKSLLFEGETHAGPRYWLSVFEFKNGMSSFFEESPYGKCSQTTDFNIDYTITHKSDHQLILYIKFPHIVHKDRDPFHHMNLGILYNTRTKSSIIYSLDSYNGKITSPSITSPPKKLHLASL